MNMPRPEDRTGGHTGRDRSLSPFVLLLAVAATSLRYSSSVGTEPPELVARQEHGARLS